MPSDAFYQKAVTASDISNMKFSQISKQARKMIRQYGLSSLDGLLGENWETEARRLAEEHWKSPGPGAS